MFCCCKAILVLHFSLGHSLTRKLEDWLHRQNCYPCEMKWIFKQEVNIYPIPQDSPCLLLSGLLMKDIHNIKAEQMNGCV